MHIVVHDEDERQWDVISLGIGKLVFCSRDCEHEVVPIVRGWTTPEELVVRRILRMW